MKEPKTLYKENGRWEVYAGSRIEEAIAEAYGIATQQEAVSFEFNEVTVIVAHDSDMSAIHRDFMRAMSGYIKGPIGPYPNPLTAEEMANDARIEAENEARRTKQQEEYDREQKSKEVALNAKLEEASPIELRDAAAWEKQKEINTDPYGAAVVSYAETWARLMQLEMAAGKKIAEIAESTSREADVEGVTGFMYGCAVSILAQCWKYGEALRLWHNKTSQLGTEGDAANESGGVLNPACLVMKT